MATDQELKELEIGGREVEGSLRVFKFPDVLQFLSLGKMTGVLQLQQEDRRVELAFREGKIINVASSDRYMRLGQMLLYSGHITRETLNEALEIQERGPGSKFLGEILVTHNLIDPEKLQQTLRLQLEDELWELFSWDSGNFRFEQGTVRDPGSVLVELDIAPLLQEGQRRMEQWHALCRNINNPSEVFCLNPEFRLTSELNIDEKSWRVLAFVNGRLSVDGIVRLSNMGKFETYWALDHFLKCDAIVRTSDMRHHVAPGEAANQPATGDYARAHGGFPAPPPMRGEAQENGPKADAKAKPTMLGGLFGKKKAVGAKEAAPVDEAPEPADFVGTQRHLTDISLICAAVNHFSDAVAAETGNRGQEFFTNWLHQTWISCEQRFPRSDHLVMRDGHLDASLFDRYVRAEKGLTRPLLGAHDDAMEALRLFWSRLKDLASDSLNDMAAGSRIADRAARPFISMASEIHADNFSFLDWKDASNLRHADTRRSG